MIKSKLEISYNSCSIDELTEEERLLVERAREATRNSFAPYSNFHVGAALMLKNGKVIIVVEKNERYNI